MTKEKLSQYKSKKEEIKELKYKLDHLGEGDSMIGYDVILDYRSGQPMPQAVVGVDWDKMDRMAARYERSISRLERECEEMEIYIESIANSQVRRIFRMYFVDGKSLEQVAEMMHMERSTIGKKIMRYLKVSHKSHNSHV